MESEDHRPVVYASGVALLERRGGWKHGALAIVMALAVAVFPFAYYANVSWFDYVAWLRLSGNTGLLLSTLKQNVEWAVYLSVPLMVSYYAVPRSLRPGSLAWATR